MKVPEEYVVAKFFEFGHFPQHNKFNNTYQCACPICREGKSFGKKKRCYYIPEKDIIFCHNCGWSSKPINWISKLSGISINDLYQESQAYDTCIDILKESPTIQKFQIPALPRDSINLFDKAQTDFYKNNKIVQQALQYLKKRKLDKAINRPDAFYISLVDPYQKNRIIIPFFNEQKKIEFYQTRVFLESDQANVTYYSKLNTEKCLFNINKIDHALDYVFILEGPFDACFLRNAVATAGITKSTHTFTPRQQKQINTTLKFFRKIWVLDSQWIDKTSFEKTKLLIENGEEVFIWPKNIGSKFKDINEICITKNTFSINPQWILKNTFKGFQAQILINTITRIYSEDS
jgi:hypothetical protein